MRTGWQRRSRVDEDKRWLAESEIAITEASTRDIILGLPVLGGL
jgi:hypothetical protein